MSTSGATQEQLEKLRKYPTFQTVCPTSKMGPNPGFALENISMYQTID